MARSEAIVCDRCGKPAREAVTIRLVTGREADASGNGYNDTVKVLDLCASCVRNMCQAIFELSTGPLLELKDTLQGLLSKPGILP